MIDLNKIPRKILFITNLIVIILFLAAIFMLFVEINYIKNHGGQCINNPVMWAEQYALEKTGRKVDCSCNYIDTFNISELNKSGG